MSTGLIAVTDSNWSIVKFMQHKEIIRPSRSQLTPSWSNQRSLNTHWQVITSLPQQAVYFNITPSCTDLCNNAAAGEALLPPARSEPKMALMSMEFRVSFTLRPFYFVPKQMICFKSSLHISLGSFCVQLCKMGQSAHTHSRTSLMPSLPRVCWSRFASWDGVMTTATKMSCELPRWKKK